MMEMQKLTNNVLRFIGLAKRLTLNQFNPLLDK
jgi:hypothetical protein